MSSYKPAALPDASFTPSHGPISALFVGKGLRSFHAAVRYVGNLPYGRTTNRADYTLVLSEGRGACSGKHALLAALASELAIEVELVLGIYEMTGENTPGVGPVLAQAGMHSIPEAHCYLRYRGERFDVTFGPEPSAPNFYFLVEESIRPHDIGDHKTNIHRQFLTEWLGTLDEKDVEKVWQIRENCIQALTVKWLTPNMFK